MNRRTAILSAIAIAMGLAWTGYRIGRGSDRPPAPTRERATRATAGTPVRPRSTARRNDRPEERTAPARIHANLQKADEELPPLAEVLAKAQPADDLEFNGRNLFPEPLYMGDPPLLLEWPGLTDPRRQSVRYSFPFHPSNLSRGKPVTASDPMPVIGELDMVTDGDKKGIDGSWVELAEGVQFVQIDLAQTHEIAAISLLHFYASPRVYHDVQIWISSDETFTNAASIFNNDTDNSLGHGAGTDAPYLETHLGLVRTFAPVRGRFVRAYSRGSTADAKNQYVELEVYGR